MILLCVVVFLTFVLGAWVTVYSLWDGSNQSGVYVGVFIVMVSLFVAFFAYQYPPEVSISDIPYCVDDSAGK